MFSDYASSMVGIVLYCSGVLLIAELVSRFAVLSESFVKLSLNWTVTEITRQCRILHNSVELAKFCGNRQIPWFGSKFHGPLKAVVHVYSQLC